MIGQAELGLLFGLWQNAGMSRQLYEHLHAAEERPTLSIRRSRLAAGALMSALGVKPRAQGVSFWRGLLSVLRRSEETCSQARSLDG